VGGSGESCSSRGGSNTSGCTAIADSMGQEQHLLSAVVEGRGGASLLASAYGYGIYAVGRRDQAAAGVEVIPSFVSVVADSMLHACSWWCSA
jgi:hypothetical protein